LGINTKKRPKVRSYRFISILDKMVGLDLLKTVLSVLSVVVVIIVSRQFIRILSKAIEGQIAHETVLNILGLNMLIALGTFLPASIFMAILMVLGRMYRDEEMAAVASAGGGVGVIYRAIFLAVLPLALVAALMSLVSTPWAEAKIRLLFFEDQKVADIRGISAGKFSEYSQGDLVLYTSDIDANKRMHQVFMQNRSTNNLGVVNAQYGQLKYLPGGLYLILENGERVRAIPGQRNLTLEKFDLYAVRIERKSVTLRQKRDGLPSWQLWQSDDLQNIAALQDRLSIPLGVIFLSFLAVPLAKLSPRGGIYSSLLIAFAIYFIYGNLNRLTHSWVVNKIIPSSYGYFAIYLLLLFVGIVLLVRLYGWQWIFIKIRQRFRL